MLPNTDAGAPLTVVVFAKVCRRLYSISRTGSSLSVVLEENTDVLAGRGVLPTDPLAGCKSSLSFSVFTLH